MEEDLATKITRLTQNATAIFVHREYMKYDQYLSGGYPIGTGVVESACSHVVKIEWKYQEPDGEFLVLSLFLRLRSIVKSNDWDKYWEFYTQQARRYDLLSAEANSLNLKQKKGCMILVTLI